MADFTGQNIQDTYQRVVQIDGGRLEDGLGNALPISMSGNDVVIDGTLRAQSYIVTESITIQTTGSTLFGDDDADNHKFLGSITASGNISASGHVSSSGYIQDGGNFHVKYEDGQQAFIAGKTAPNDIMFGIGTTNPGVVGLEVVGTISASHALGGPSTIFSDKIITGHISASGNISASGGITVNTVLANVGIQSSGNVVVQQPGQNGSVLIDKLGHISASGDVTASGNITADNAAFQGELQVAFGGVSTDGIKIGAVGAQSYITNINGLRLQGNSLDPTQTTTAHVTIGADASITASSNISASGDVRADNYFSNNQHVFRFDGETIKFSDDQPILFQTNITASGDISSSGTVTGKGVRVGTDRLSFVNNSNTILAQSQQTDFAGTLPYVFTPNVVINNNVTASGNISASGDTHNFGLGIVGTGAFHKLVGNNVGEAVHLLQTQHTSANRPAHTIYSSSNCTFTSGIDRDQESYVIASGANIYTVSNQKLIIGTRTTSNLDLVVPNISMSSGDITGSISSTFSAATGSFHVLKGKDASVSGLVVGGFVSASGIVSASSISASGDLCGNNLFLENDLFLGNDATINGDLVTFLPDGGAGPTIRMKDSSNDFFTDINQDNSFHIDASHHAAMNFGISTNKHDAGTNLGATADSVTNHLFLDGGTGETVIHGPILFGNLHENANVTASGDISASGAIYSNTEQYWSTTARLVVDDNDTNYFGPNPQGTNYYYWSRDLGTSATTITSKTQTMNSGFKLPYKAILTGYHLNIQGRSTTDNIEFTLVYSDGMWDGDVTSTSQTLVAAESAQEVTITSANNFYELDRRDQFAIPVNPMTMIYPRFKKTAATGGTTYDLQLSVQYRVVK